MDDPLFLQEMEKDVYKQNSVKSTDQIISDYIDYADRLYSTTQTDVSNYGLPPLTIMVKPLMSLFKGKQGRIFRKSIQETLKSATNPSQFPSIVTNALKQSLIK